MKRAILFLKILISLGLLSYLAYRATAEDQFAVLFHGGRNYVWFGLAVICGLLATLITFYRWYLLARGLGLTLGLLETIRVSFVSVFFGLFAFGVVGTDSVRAYTAARSSPGKRIEAVASVFVDRVLGLLTMFLLAAGGYYLQDPARWQRLDSAQGQAIEFLVQLCGWLAIALLAGGIVLQLVPQLRRQKWFSRLTHLPMVGGLLTRLVGVLLLYRSNPLVLATGLGLSIVSSLMFALTIYLLAVFCGGSYPSLMDHCIIAPISLVANSVPLPGGLGGMETMVDILYRAFATEDGGQPMGVVIAFAFRFIFLLVSAIGGFVWFSLDRAERETLQTGSAS